MKLVVLSAAEREIAEAVEYYMAESVAAALTFEQELSEAFKRIQSAPNTYRSDERGIHTKVVSGFPFSVYYRVTAEYIEVLSVAHQSRYPGYWMDRAS